MWRKGGVITTLLLLRSDSSPAKKMRKVVTLSMNGRSEFCPDAHSLTETHSALILVSYSLHNTL
jgi:hypothetical protein